MKFSLIICTYKRPKPLFKLLQSVKEQSLCPDEILIIDGSPDNQTEKIITQNRFQNLQYFKVEPKDRGLTRQRNFGIQKVTDSVEIVCFLDDDIVLESDYFKELINTYYKFPEALGVGGYIINEAHWKKVEKNYSIGSNEFFYDGWVRQESSRYKLRKKLGLDSNCAPGIVPEFSHGRSIGFLPPSGKIYETELLMGGVSSFRKKVFEQIKFSTYFEGYGLYEDADFCIRLSKLGKLYCNTAAQLNHYHEPSGRPNQYKYGKMVVRNGWYVWRVKNPNPTIKVQLKWHVITLLLTGIRATNVISTTKRKEAFTETFGRIVGWFSLFLNQPKV